MLLKQRKGEEKSQKNKERKERRNRKTKKKNSTIKRKVENKQTKKEK